jgi:hypothetical protein
VPTARKHAKVWKSNREWGSEVWGQVAGRGGLVIPTEAPRRARGILLVTLERKPEGRFRGAAV